MTDVNVDLLPPTQYLILDDLGGRWRSGETLWTFPTRLRAAVEALAALGLVGWKSGVVERTIQVWLTDAGQEAVLDDAYLREFKSHPVVLQVADAIAAQDEEESAAHHLAVTDEMVRRGVAAGWPYTTPDKMAAYDIASATMRRALMAALTEEEPGD